MTEEKLIEDSEEHPSVERILGHEAGNWMAKLPIAFPEKEGEDRLWDGNSEAIAAYHDYKESFEDGDLRKRAEAYRTLEGFNSPSTPERPRKILDRTLDMMDAAEAYQGLREEGPDSEDEILLGEALSPVESCIDLGLCEGVDADYDPDTEIRGNESLRVVSNTVIKNWLEHGEAEEPDSRLWIEQEESDEYAKILAYDNGPGLEGNPDDLFSYEPGTDGIGLPTAAYILESFGGSIDYFEPDTGGMGYEIDFERSQ